MRLVIAAVLVVGFLTRPAAAQIPPAWQLTPLPSLELGVTSPVTPGNGDPHPGLTTASWLYVATATADWSVTAACGGAEVNCSGKYAAGPFLWNLKHEAVAVTLGLAIDAGILIGARELLGEDYPTWAKVILYAVSAARMAVLGHRIGKLRGHRAPDRP